MFEDLRRERLWSPLLHRYPYGAQWPYDADNMTVDVVDGIDVALRKMGIPFRVGLETAPATARAREGFRKPPIRGFFVFDGKDTYLLKLRASPSFAVLGKRPMFLGDQGAVLTLVNAFVDEMENVVALDEARNESVVRNA